jgi:CubicO group peptidase (beta-lactamase class C family)
MSAIALDDALDRALAERRVVGAVVQVAREGEVVYGRAAGLADRESGGVMGDDTVFRLSSLSKPICTAAVMALVEQGVLALDEPVTSWLPDFRPRMPSGQQPTITVHHLLTHTAGLGAPGLAEEPDDPYRSADVGDGMRSSGARTLAENTGLIATLPLYFEPGTDWKYSVGIDVLGSVMEAATGENLPAVVEGLVTGPLGLQHVGFSAVEVDEGTLATPYADGDPEPVRMTDPYSHADFPLIYSPSRALDPAAFPSAGAGMVGTAPEMLTFLETVRTGGGGILQPSTTAMMMANQLGDLKPDPDDPGWGFGYGAAVLGGDGDGLSTSTWSWAGGYGHVFFVDPVSATTIVVLTNTAFEGVNGQLVDDVVDAATG